MKAITIWQPWATLIMAGVKPHEFRRWPAPQSLIGQRIVIHAGGRKVVQQEIRELRYRLHMERLETGLVPEPALALLARIAPGDYPLASGLGTVLLGQPIRATDLYKDVNDSDRIDHHVWAWPTSDPQPFEPYMPARGAQGFWEWPN